MDKHSSLFNLRLGDNEKRFITLKPVVNVIKHFFQQTNKL